MLTSHFQVHALNVLTNGVASSAEVLAGIRELHVLQSERGHAGITAYNDITIQTLEKQTKRNTNE